MNNTSHWPASENRMLYGIAGNIMLLTVGIWGYSGYLAEVSYWEEQIEQYGQLIVFSTYISALYFTWVSLVPILLILNIHILFKDVFKRSIPRMVLQLQNLLIGVMFLGLFLLVSGSVFVNPKWEEHFREAGFVECENRVLNFRKSVFNEVWVRDSDHCQDRRLRLILHERFSRDGFELASRYLQALNDQSATQ